MDRDPDFTRRRGARFDPTINLGHIITGATTVITMGAALGTMWVNFKVTESQHASRLDSNDKAITELKETTRHLAETQQQMSLTEQKLSLTLEYLAKQQGK